MLFGGVGTLETPTGRTKRESKSNPFRAAKKSRRRGAKKPQRKDSNEPERLINWPNVIWLTILHVGCLAAPFFFSWQAVLLTRSEERRVGKECRCWGSA